jgi:hypothetical protein
MQTSDRSSTAETKWQVIEYSMLTVAKQSAGSIETVDQCEKQTEKNVEGSGFGKYVYPEGLRKH